MDRGVGIDPWWIKTNGSMSCQVVGVNGFHWKKHREEALNNNGERLNNNGERLRCCSVGVVCFSVSETMEQVGTKQWPGSLPVFLLSSLSHL